MSGVFFAGLLRLPGAGCRRFRIIKAQHQSAAVKCSEEQPRPELARRSDGHSRARLERYRPKQAAAFRIQRIDAFGVPDDELPSPAGLANDRRAVAQLLGVERAPEFFPGLFVER